FTRSPRLRNVDPLVLASSLPRTVFPTPGVPVTMMILAKDCSGAPAGTLRPLEAFEPGSPDRESGILSAIVQTGLYYRSRRSGKMCFSRSEEHTSELQSRVDLVCRLLLE